MCAPASDGGPEAEAVPRRFAAYPSSLRSAVYCRSMMTDRSQTSDKLRPGEAREDRPWFALLGVLILLLAVGISYGNSLDAALVFDDIPEIVKEPNFRSFGAAVATRRPVGAVSFWANIRLFGMSAPALRIVNVAVHAVAGLILFLLLRRLLPKALPSAGPQSSNLLALLVSLLWCVHPLQTQAVTYVVQRYESLMGMFFLASVLFSAWFIEGKRRRWIVLAAAACALSCGSKAVGIAVPPAVLLIDAALYSGGVLRALRRHLALYVGLLIGASMVVVTGVARGVLDPSRTRATVGLGFPGASPLDYLLTQLGVVAHYVRLTYWPDVLCIDYAWPFARAIADLHWTAAIVPLVLIAAAAAWKFKPVAALPVALAALVLLPTSSVIPLQDAAVEHRMYLSLAPLLAAAVACVFVGARRMLRKRRGGETIPRSPHRAEGWTMVVVLALLVPAAIALVGRTRSRNEDYRSNVSLWRQTIAVAPHNARAHYNLARALHREEAQPSLERLQAAYDEYRESLRLEPGNAEAYVGCAEILASSGQPIAAIELYETALELDPSLAVARCHYAAELADLGRFAEAEPHYRRALETAPHDFGCLYNYGTMLLQRGDAEAAADMLERAIVIHPSSGIALHNLGIALRRTRQLDEAIEVLRRAVAVRPDHIGTRCTLAEALLDAGLWDACEAEIARVLRSYPNHERASRIAQRLAAARGR